MVGDWERERDNVWWVTGRERPCVVGDWERERPCDYRCVVRERGETIDVC